VTHDELVERAVKWLRGRHKCRVVFAEITTYARSIPDAIGWRSLGHPCCILVECKTSRADFKRDAIKPSHRSGRVLGRYRWYLTPPGLLTADEVPGGWGLAEACERFVRVVVEAPDTGVPDFAAYQEETTILLSACRRHQVGVDWNHGRARFTPVDGELKPVKTDQREMFE